MHQFIRNKPSIVAVRSLVREEGSSLIDDVADAQIDALIHQLVDRPAATSDWLASIAGWTAESAGLAASCAAVADGSVLDCPPSLRPS